MLGTGFSIKQCAVGVRNQGSIFNGATAVYIPSVLSSLWQDASGTVPVISDGDPVGRIEDQSGNGYDMIQTTAAARPTYRTDGARHWLEADGVDDQMTAATRFGLSASPALTIVAALRPISYIGNDDRVFHIGKVGTGTKVLAASLGAEGQSWRHDGGNARFGAIATGSDTVLSWWRAAAASFSAQHAAVDGVERGLISAANGSAEPVDTTSQACLFNRGPGGAQWGHMRLYGLVLYAQELPSGSRHAVEAGLAQQAGVTL
ncbi:hypothetical protein FHY55_13915 [Oceanicola sp. D3]|uniref:hypothetical protein n=1 Tax=Oceanicola sp. D3 TaxID=2587163 RepID=UPI0011204DD4|nr:hypothetical protein [Oceanicola sp. D3]QDC10274.1 hypothetical protein FHY55_13915 [Oceanicola sp. D3]